MIGEFYMNHLSETESRMLNEALDDEYLAWATYDQVIADFGEVRPFSNIRAAEGRVGCELLFSANDLEISKSITRYRCQNSATVRTFFNVT